MTITHFTKKQPMTSFYTNHIQAQAESNNFGNEVVKGFNNDLNSKHYYQKKKITISDQSSRIVDINEWNRKDWKLYCLQIFYYLHVGIGNTREWSQEYIRDWIGSAFGITIRARSLYNYNERLKRQGYLNITPTKYSNSDGKRVHGHNEYTLIKVDAYIHCWQQDMPLLSVGKKFADTLNNNLKVIRTISNDQSFSSDDSLQKVKKKKVKSTDPETIQDPKTWWPNGAAAEVLTEQFGPSYCAQEPIVSEFQKLMAADYPEGLPRRLLNYKFIAFAKTTKPLKEQYGVSYMSFAKRRHYNKTHQHAPKTEFKAYVQKTPIASPLIAKERTHEEMLADIAKISAENKVVRDKAKAEFIAVHGIPSSVGSPEGMQWKLRLDLYCNQAVDLYRESVKLNE